MMDEEPERVGPQEMWEGKAGFNIDPCAWRVEGKPLFL